MWGALASLLPPRAVGSRRSFSSRTDLVPIRLGCALHLLVLLSRYPEIFPALVRDPALPRRVIFSGSLDMGLRDIPDRGLACRSLEVDRRRFQLGRLLH